MTTVGELSEQLRAQGLIAADAPVAPVHNTDRPWFVALLQGVAGWLAGIFLLVFLGLVFRPESGGAFFVIGTLLLGAAWFLYRADRDAVFLDQLALAISIAGQFAVAASVIKDDLSGLSIATTAFAVQVFVLIVMPNRIARTLAALFATIAWAFTRRFLFIGELTPPLGWVLTWLPLLALAGWLVLREPQWMASSLRRFARPVLTGVLLGLSLGGMAAEPFSVMILGTESLGMRFSWWALFPLLSIGLALASAYGAFRVRSAGLLGFAVLAALLHLSRFYYLYGTTLMWKSVIMLTAGALLLLAGVWLRRRDPHAEASA
ncbi:MAG TPA: DUF4401 domain-containing protein [Steroidobacteraceae bacterium]|nr:DUF4401 domain-containing protein [Steroidobacteraceae bacterium]